MSSRKKKSKKQPSSQPEVQNIIGRAPVLEQEFREDLGWWYKNNPQKAFKVLDIVQDVLRDPFGGIGKPEPLKYL